MRLMTDNEIQCLTKEEANQFLSKHHFTLPSSATLDELRSMVANSQRNRSFAIWHDHSTILKQGYILFAVWVLYDPALFLTEEEYARKMGQSIKNMQALVEQPKIYMIAPSTSSPSDQLSLTGDRLECLQELTEYPMTTSSGIQINDTVRFFCGDKPAQQFERARNTNWGKLQMWRVWMFGHFHAQLAYCITLQAQVITRPSIFGAGREIWQHPQYAQTLG